MKREKGYLYGIGALTNERGDAARCALTLEFEVSGGLGCTGRTIGTGGRQQTYDTAQTLPGRLIQGWIGTYEVADHVPSGQVERALRRWSHGERDRALRTEGDAVGRRLLAWFDANSLREHVEGDRLLPRAKLAITAKAMHVLQESLLVADCGLRNMNIVVEVVRGASM